MALSTCFGHQGNFPRTIPGIDRVHHNLRTSLVRTYGQLVPCFLRLLTLNGTSLVTRAFSDLLQRSRKCHTHTPVLEPSCSPAMHLSSFSRGRSAPHTIGRGAAGHLPGQACPGVSFCCRRAGHNSRASQSRTPLPVLCHLHGCLDLGRELNAGTDVRLDQASDE